MRRGFFILNYSAAFILDNNFKNLFNMRYEPAGEKTMMVKKQGADDVYIKKIRLKLVVLLSIESV
jgi:hypothetical protein